MPVWSEVRDEIAPIVARVLAGEASYFEDMPLTVERNGYPEETWWTFSYSRICAEAGGVGGILYIVHEVTERVLAERRLRFVDDLSGRARRVWQGRSDGHGLHGRARLAVQAMKASAVDYLEAPYTAQALLAAVASALAGIQDTAESDRAAEGPRTRVAALSVREREVLDGLLVGGTNKTIAKELGISPRTVEIHRAHLLERLGARTLPGSAGPCQRQARLSTGARRCFVAHS